MTQTAKFYLASFLKNQIYFVPIMVIFFQDLGLSYSEIFWIVTGGAMFSFVIEVPTGVMADLYGKRLTIILSKLVILIGFVAFGFADGFWTLLIANLIFELGKSLRSGTETAYVYDYLKEHPEEPSYTKVKAGQKFYARLSESIATAVGGFIAVHLGFHATFLIAAVPAAINFLAALTWAPIAENKVVVTVNSALAFAQSSIKTILTKRELLIISLNILFFSTVFVALGVLVQPYMVGAGVPLEWFGVIYSGFLLLMALFNKYSSNLEERFGGVRVMNVLTLLAVVPLLILGLGFESWVGIGLFFAVLAIENFRSTIANTVFHDHVDSTNRATMGSIVELFKTGGQIMVLPAVGYLADAYSIYTAILLLGIVTLITGTLFYVRTERPTNHTL